MKIESESSGNTSGIAGRKRRYEMKRSLVLVILILTLSLISMNGTYAGSLTLAEAHQGNPDTKSPQDMPALSGKIVETMDSGGYTYVHIVKDSKKVWVAVPRMKVTVGQDISFQPGMVMNNFTSKTLGRTFESVVFSNGITEQPGTESVEKSGKQREKEVTKNVTVKIEKAPGPDAYTVAELYGKSSTLDKKKVVIRGRVVKVSEEIMGKNWIHIQDGSGNPSNGTNDIVVTSEELFSVGDIVTVKGTLYEDKDFGSGYKYDVIVEQASIEK